MTAVWIALIAIGAIASLGAGAWLIAIAFRESVGWGIACLFGIPAVIFVVRYWEDVKLPFAYSLVGWAVAVTGLVGYSVSSVNADLGQFTELDDAYAWEARPLSVPDEPDTTVTPETDSPNGEMADEAGENPMSELDEQGEAEASDATPATQRTPASIAERRRGFLVPLERLPAYERERIVITLKNGERIFVYVLDVRDDSIEVRRSVGGGSVTFDVSLSEIEEVRSRKVL